MLKSEYLLIVVGMGVVTYLPRWLPLLFLSNRKPPRWVIEWLELIPVAILSALLMPVLFTSGEPRFLYLLKPELLVAIPTFLVACKTQSMGGTVLAGMIMFWAYGAFIS